MTTRRDEAELERQAEAVGRALREAPEEDVPPEVEARILAMAAEVARQPLPAAAETGAARPPVRRTWRWLVPATALAAAAVLVVMVRPAGQVAPQAEEVLVAPPATAREGLRREPAGAPAFVAELVALRPALARDPRAETALEVALRAAAEGRAAEAPSGFTPACPGPEQTRLLWREGDRPLVLWRRFADGRAEWSLYPGAGQATVGVVTRAVETPQGPRLAVRLAPGVTVPEGVAARAEALGCALR